MDVNSYPPNNKFLASDKAIIAQQIALGRVKILLAKKKARIKITKEDSKWLESYLANDGLMTIKDK